MGETVRKLPRDQYLKSIPRKRIAAGALYFNSAGELLIVKPNYQEQWNIPGGAGEVNESPQETCRREVNEEIGISQKFDKLLVIDHLFNHETLDETLVFIFLGGTMTGKQLKKIKLKEDELTEYAFKPINNCLSLLGPKMAKRLPYCINAIKKSFTVLI